MAAADLDLVDTDTGWGRWRWPLRVLVVGAVVSGVVLRFVSRSPLWLDEALSVNIATLPLGEIPDALRVDGHPPLYYVLLHGWMELFGTGPVAVRSFSGLWALGLFPLIWVAARRLGGNRVATYAVALLALSPFAIRYGTETRMYAMVSVLTLGLWLLVSDALERPTRARLGGIALITGALLWSHYWAMWFLAAGGIGLVVHAIRSRRANRPDDLGASVRVIGALV
ncbi:MAG: glycosyltransferase family 39 protein, partial [Acidimicrobiia bacterium]|nr:glycosyltransferase family 39 protein [Acidimicrobiia bacterium]